MTDRFTDEMIDHLGILAKLDLTGDDRELLKQDMGKMLAYIDKMNELDTEGVTPMSHVFPLENVFREDIVTGTDDRESLLANAPDRKDGSFKVPRTVE